MSEFAMSFSAMVGKQPPKEPVPTLDDFPALGSTPPSRPINAAANSTLNPGASGWNRQLAFNTTNSGNTSTNHIVGGGVPHHSQTQMQLNNTGAIFSQHQLQHNQDVLHSQVPSQAAMNQLQNVNNQVSYQQKLHGMKNGETNTAQYGVLGLLDILRLNDTDMASLSLGMDLTSLGLNLNNSDPLHLSFVSPFADQSAVSSEPFFNLPQCYSLPSFPPPALTKITSMADETLFYIFYSVPRDVLQEAAAQELYNRNWRFHKELKLWLTKDPASPEAVKGAGFERGIYYFFDPTTWIKLKKEWVIYMDQIEERVAVSANGTPNDTASNNTTTPSSNPPNSQPTIPISPSLVSQLAAQAAAAQQAAAVAAGQLDTTQQQRQPDPQVMPSGYAANGSMLGVSVPNIGR